MSTQAVTEVTSQMADHLLALVPGISGSDATLVAARLLAAVIDASALPGRRMQVWAQAREAIEFYLTHADDDAEAGNVAVSH